MDQQVLLSIVVPTYNRFALLQKTVASILSQTLSDWGKVEVVVTDNASDDGTVEYLKNVQHRSLKLHFSTSNYGVIANFKKGISIASGNYVWLIGSDDLLVENSLQMIVNLLQQEKPDLAFLNNYFYFPSQESDNYKLNDDKHYEKRILYPKPTGIYKTRELIGLRVDAFTSIYSIILTKQDWADACNLHDASIGLFDTAENCIPHAMFIASNKANSRCCYIAEPPILASHEVGWNRFFPLYFMQFLPDLYEVWQRNGVSKKEMRIAKQALFTETNHLANIDCVLGDSELKKRFRKLLYLKRFYHTKGILLVLTKMIKLGNWK